MADAPRPWATLVVIYRATDARFGRWGRSRVDRTMSADEYEATRSVLGAVPSSVEAWSEGNASLYPFEIVDAQRPVESLSDAGAGAWWLGPDDCRPEIGAWAPPGRFDCILAVWPCGGDVRLCGWGCTIGPSPAANGAGFSSCISDAWQGYATQPNPTEGFVHEWLHQVEATLRLAGAGADVFPDLHDAGHLRSGGPDDQAPFGRTYGEHHERTGTWQPWYRDYMTGRVLRPDGSGIFGIERATWALR